VLGHRFSGLVAIQPGHVLATCSIYGVIRHPSYLGLLLKVLGWALGFRSGVGVLLAPLNLLPLRGYVRRRDCCTRISAASTMPTALVPGG